MSRVEFTYEENLAIAKAVDKMWKKRLALPASAWKKPENMLVKELARIFPVPPVPTVEEALTAINSVFVRPLNRNHGRMLENIATASYMALTTGIIPSYKERIAKETDATLKAEYEAYLIKAQKMADIYSSIKQKMLNEVIV